MDNPFVSYRIDDRSFVAYLKREIHNLTLNTGFTTHRAGEIDIIISELTSNLIKFADEGEILYKATIEDGKPFIEVLCIDNGKGISNINRIMQDGFSSANTLGHGLGSIKRLSDDFQIYSLRDWGTVQYIKVGSEKNELLPTRKKNLDYGVMQVCAPGEQVCGYGYHIKYTQNGFQIFVGDGLGHGPNANDAVAEAIKAFKICRETDPVEILRDIHNSTRKTRGLVATVAAVDYKTATWQICGIGNISTRIYNGLENKTYSPYNGIVGHNIPRTLNTTKVPYEKHQTIIMHSDGLRTRWKLTDLQSILKQTPNIIAASLYKDNLRGNDDVTVFVGKIN